MDAALKKELHEVSVNIMFNVGATGKLADQSLFSALIDGVIQNYPRCTPEEMDYCNAVMGQMAALRFTGTPADDAKRHFVSSTAHIESFAFTKGVNVLTGIFQDVLGEGFLEEIIPDFALEEPVRNAMREVGANNLADACDFLALRQ